MMAESPQRTMQFMKQLAKSPWASVVKLVEDLPREESDHHGMVPEYDSSEDSDCMARVCQTTSDSNDSDSDREERVATSSLPLQVERPPLSLAVDNQIAVRLPERPKSRKFYPPSSAASKKKLKKPSPVEVSNDCANRKVVSKHSKSFYPRLKPLRVVLIDLSRYLDVEYEKSVVSKNEQSGLGTMGSQRLPVSSGGESGDAMDSLEASSSVRGISEVVKTLDSKSWSKNDKRPGDLSWKGTFKTKTDNDQKVELSPFSATKISGGVSNGSAKSNPPPCDSTSKGKYELSHWGKGLFVQELLRLQELAEKLRKDPMDLEGQKSVAHKLKGSMNAVALLVAKKSLNRIVAEQEKINLNESQGQMTS